jgi:hypothetical protein
MLEGIGMDEERSDEGLVPRQHVDLGAGYRQLCRVMCP